MKGAGRPSAAVPLRITVATRGGERHLSVDGDIDIATCAQVADAIGAALSRHRAVVLELSGVGFLDAAGVGVLLAGWRRAGSLGGTLRVDGAAGPVRRILELLGALDPLTRG